MSSYITILPASWLSRGMFIVTSVAIFGSYFIALYQREVPPIPSITATGINYPQYIIFRIGNLSVTPILGLVYFLQYQWLSQQRLRIERTLALAGKDSAGLAEVPKCIIYLGIFAALAFGLCIASISDGYMNVNLHIYWATLPYFLASFINFSVITYTTYRLRLAEPAIFSDKAYFIKLGVLASFVGILLSLELFTACTHSNPPEWAQNLLEWALVLLIGAFLYSFAYDFADFTLVIQDSGDKYPSCGLVSTRNEDASWVLMSKKKFDV